MRKTVILSLILILFIFLVAAEAKAAPPFTVSLDGEPINFSSPVEVVEGSMYAPARELAEAMHFTVAWHANISAMSIDIGADQYLFMTKEKMVYRNGREESNSVKAEVINSRTMLPVRFLGELFNLDVVYDGATKTADLRRKDTYLLRIMDTAIMGDSIATAEQMAAYLLKYNSAPKIPLPALQFAQLFLDEGAAEGVRGDFAFAQSIHETGFFRFRGDVGFEQFNYSGLGATGGGVKGNVFATPQIGVRAQIQHLKGYATHESLNNPLVDQRWLGSSPARGSAPNLEQLAQALNPSGVGWAYPGYNKYKYANVQEAYEAGQTYGQSVHRIFLKIIGHLE